MPIFPTRNGLPPLEKAGMVMSQQTEMQAIQWTYPDLFNRNHRTETDRAIAMARCAILANTNDRVGAWNQAVQQLVPSNQSKIYYSANHLCDLEGTDAARRGTNTQEVITEEFLHYCDKADVPVHKLFLKVGDLAILMRNIDKAAGLTNNQRVVIQGLRRHTVVVSIANDPRKEPHYISRLSFRFTVPGTSFDMIRKQFPIKLAYAFTVHKAQGQELGQVLIDTSTPTFAHGQLYVALSRVTHRRSLAVYMPEEQRLTGQVTADNVVLTQLIEYLTNS